MKIFFLISLLVSIAASQEATYISAHSGTDRNGNTGFRAQIEGVPYNDENGFDIDLPFGKNIPYNLSLVNMSSDEAYKTNLSDIDWCSNGMRRIKVYVPPYIKSEAIGFIVSPNNTVIVTATYRPTGVIDEQNVLYSENLKYSERERALAEGKTLMFTVTNNGALTINESFFKDNGIDNTKNGGWLYLSVTQADGALQAARDYDSRYVFSTSVTINFQHPFTDEMRRQVLSVIPAGMTEPAEEPLRLITRECKDPKTLTTVPEAGVAMTPEEECDANGIYYDPDKQKCYYRNDAEYRCEVTDNPSGTWNGSRCVYQKELDCNADSDTQWYVGGGLCLDKDKTAVMLESNASVSSIGIGDFDIENNTTAYIARYYQANDEGWATSISLQNVNASSSTVQKVTILDSQEKELNDIDVTLASGKEWKGILFVDAGQLKLTGRDPAGGDGNVTYELGGSTTDNAYGTIMVLPEKQVNLSETKVEMKYGVNLYRAPVDTTSEIYHCEKVCGGMWIDASGTCRNSKCDADGTFNGDQGDSAVPGSLSEFLKTKGEFEITGWFVTLESKNDEKSFSGYKSLRGTIYIKRDDARDMKDLWRRLDLDEVSQYELKENAILIYVGDWNHDKNDLAYDWIIIDPVSQKVYKLDKTLEKGYEINVDFRREENRVYFN